MSKITYKTGEQSESDPFTFIMSTEAVDADGDVIHQDGWNLKRFKKNPIALFGHSHDMIIGTWKNVRVEGKRLLGQFVPAQRGTSRIVDEVRSLIEQRILKAVSVGFMPKEYEPRDKENPWDGFNLMENELLECSLVAVPSNPQAVLLSKQIGISEQTRKLIFGHGVKASTITKSRKGKNAPLDILKSPRLRSQTMKLGERIIAAQESIDGFRSEIEDIMKGFEDEGRDATEEEEIQIEALEAEIESKTRTLNTLKSAEKSMGIRSDKKAKDNDPSGNFVPAVAKANEPASQILFKMAHVAVRAFVEKKSPELVLSERYSHDPRVEAVLKSATAPAYTNVVGWAQELTDTAVAGFLAELKPVSIYGRLAAAGVAIPFGDNNAVTVPRRSSQGQIPGSFVGEGNTIPVKRAGFGSQTFNRYKAAVITAFSKELARVSNPQIEALLRDAITTDTGIMLDSVITDPTSAAVAGIRPASPFFGASSQASSGDDQASILADLRFLMDTLSAANAGRNPYFIMNPARVSGLSMMINANGSFVFRDELANGRLMGYPVIVSTNCPADVVFVIDAADFGTAFGNPEFDASEQATLVMIDDDGTDPTMLDTNAVSKSGSVHVSDAAAVVGGPAQVRSMFQTWEVALRMVMPISWGMMRTGTVAYLTGVNW